MTEDRVNPPREETVEDLVLRIMNNYGFTVLIVCGVISLLADVFTLLLGGYGHSAVGTASIVFSITSSVLALTLIYRYREIRHWSHFLCKGVVVFYAGQIIFQLLFSTVGVEGVRMVFPFSLAVPLAQLIWGVVACALIPVYVLKEIPDLEGGEEQGTDDEDTEPDIPTLE